MNRRRSKRKQLDPTDGVAATSESSEVRTSWHRQVLRYWWIAAVGLLLAGVVVGWQSVRGTSGSTAAKVDIPMPSFSELDDAGVEKLCSHCHQFPQPEVLPQHMWPEKIWQMYEHARYGRAVRWPLDPEELVAWYQARAPEQFDFSTNAPVRSVVNIQFDKRTIESNFGPNPFTADIKVVDVVGDSQLELLVSDMRNGVIHMSDAKDPTSRIKRIGDVPYPARMCVVDLDRDGYKDVLVANLGSFFALDHNLGSVEWFRQTFDGQFEQKTLANHLGRVADVQTDDIDGDGDLDLIVAEFGWKSTGHLLVFENVSSRDGSIEFKQHAIDGLAGANQVAAVDFNSDGLRDIVALYSQGQEMVRCYVQRGKLSYEIVDLFRAPHPAWGFTAFQLVDLDQDQDIDILLSNGDTFDDGIIKPDHGIRWLENAGDLRFQSHDLTRLFGAYRAEASDLDNDGDLDIIACALVESNKSSEEALGEPIDSVVMLEQTSSGKFDYHALEVGSPAHATLTVADLNLDGTLELLIGRGLMQDTNAVESQVCVEVWEAKRAHEE